VIPVYLRARYYDPATGAFLSRDPAESTTREPYAYTAGNPINRIDPSGLLFATGLEDSSGPQYYTPYVLSPGPDPHNYEDTPHYLRRYNPHQPFFGGTDYLFSNTPLNDLVIVPEIGDCILYSAYGASLGIDALTAFDRYIHNSGTLVNPATGNP
jgi:hypothetical protein